MIKCVQVFQHGLPVPPLDPTPSQTARLRALVGEEASEPQPSAGLSSLVFQVQQLLRDDSGMQVSEIISRLRIPGGPVCMLDPNDTGWTRERGDQLVAKVRELGSPSFDELADALDLPDEYVQLLVAMLASVGALRIDCA